MREFGPAEARCQRVLSVDPGERAGWAWWLPIGYRASGRCNGDRVDLVAELLDKMKPDLLVVEDQYLGLVTGKGGRKVRPTPDSLFTLVRRRAIWEVLALERGARVVAVPPKVWKPWARIPPEQLASAAVGYQVTDLDQAAAISIGLWWDAQATALRAGIS